MQDITCILSDLSEIDGQPMTDSLKVAARFGKGHYRVLRAIRELVKSSPKEFTDANFGVSTYKDSTGRELPVYTMTKNGFAMLAMGFTGSAAMQWKVMYITAFDRMAEEIAKASHVPAIPMTLHEQALRLHAEAKTSEALGSMHGRGLRKRRDEKPLLVQQLAMMERALQLCLALGLSELPAIE